MITLDGLQIPWQVWKIITFMAIVAIIPVIVKIFKLMIRKTLRKVSRPIALEIEKYGTWIIWLIGVFFAIGELGLDIQILYMFIALAGVALIVAMRDALTNLMAGYYIDLYQPLKLGDWVKIGGYMGRIVKADGMNVTLLT
ncbi:TPA: mechanosensitive ion channel, partial [Candidatus Bathyarchaeota archaeon]|nr:mechanosensitive ion channel [Candidatus Bathyarchaeota archaeon]